MLRNGVSAARRITSSTIAGLGGVAPPVSVVTTEKVKARSPDVLVVGGGIIGCSTAYHLALKGASVVVLDTRGVASSQSSKSWGFCRQQGRDVRELDLMRESIQRWEGIEEELGHSVGWRQVGNLALCDALPRYNHFKTWLPLARERGLDTEMLDGKQVKEILPGLDGEWIGGIWTKSDGTADPESATRAFAYAAERRGVHFRLFSPPVDELVMDAAGDRVTGVRLADGDVISAGTTVLAAGSWTSELLRGHFRLPQLRVRATAARTERLTDISQNFGDFADIGVWAPRVSFRKRVDGTMTIADGGYAEEHEFEAYGSTMHGYKFLPGYFKNPIKVNLVHDITHQRDPNPNPRRIDQAMETFGKMFPKLPALRIKETWAAHIDMTPDMVPVMDVGGGLPNGLVVSTGFSGHGLGIAPGAGRLTADLALSGQRLPEAEVFRADRFGERLFFAPQSVF
jgi:glycine/D-amino acid oxidase-like deaminating enzyme